MNTTIFTFEEYQYQTDRGYYSASCSDTRREMTFSEWVKYQQQEFDYAEAFDV